MASNEHNQQVGQMTDMLNPGLFSALSRLKLQFHVQSYELCSSIMCWKQWKLVVWFGTSLPAQSNSQGCYFMWGGGERKECRVNHLEQINKITNSECSWSIIAFFLSWTHMQRKLLFKTYLWYLIVGSLQILLAICQLGKCCVVCLGLCQTSQDLPHLLKHPPQSSLLNWIPKQVESRHKGPSGAG